MENEDDTGGRNNDVVKRDFYTAVRLRPVSPGESGVRLRPVSPGESGVRLRPVSPGESGVRLRPVSPGESGEGLPYAPVHWPKHGDIWGWRVGYRFSKDGIFYDRFLRIPRRLQKKPTKLEELKSKPAVERYLRSEFPEADIRAFFESFTWLIPVKPELKGNYGHCKKIKTNGGNGVNKRKQKAVKTPKKNSIFNENNCINLSVDIDLHGKESFLGSQVSDEFSFDSPNDYNEEKNTLFKNSQVEVIPEEFNNYLKSLDEILDSHQDSSSSMEESMADCRKKLSLLLSIGTQNCLISSENFNELIALSYQIQNDPNLTTKELSILKLIQSIPFTSKSFLEAKEISSKADEFFNGLNSNIALVTSLKDEYNTTKEEMEFVKAAEASTLIDIMEIDQEISKLEKIRRKKAERNNINNEKLIRLNSIQKIVMGSLPKVVHEVQLAKSEKSIWELKKKKAAEEESEILAKYAPLNDFSF